MAHSSEFGEEADYHRLIAEVGDSFARFLAARLTPAKPRLPTPVNDNDPVENGIAVHPCDPMTAAQVQQFLGMSARQIAELQRYFDFPTPRPDGASPVLSRKAIEAWLISASNPENAI